MQRPLMVAELGASHCGSLDNALKLVKCAAWARADAVKLQCWTDGSMCVSDYQIQSGPWKGRGLRKLYEEAYTPWGWFPEIAEYANSLGLEWFASVFDHAALEYLESIACPRYKIASFELVDLELIKDVARTGKPLVLSLGMANDDDADRAIKVAQDAGAEDITCLHCVSAYPTPISASNLNGIRRIAGVHAGLSDHTQTTLASIIATTIGVHMIEKHLKLAGRENNLDSGFALEPADFADTVKAVDDTVSALGVGVRGPLVEEAPSRRLRRSLWVVSDAKKGDYMEDHVSSARPALGLPCAQWPVVQGLRFAHDVPAGMPLTEEMISPQSTASATK